MFSTKAASLATALYLLGTICLVSAHGYPDQVVNETGATFVPRHTHPINS